jgi:hypothetical protein
LFRNIALDQKRQPKHLRHSCEEFQNTTYLGWSPCLGVIARGLSPEAFYSIGVFLHDTHRNIGYKLIGLPKKTFIDIHRIDIPSTTPSSGFVSPLFPNTGERLLIHRLDGMPSVFPLSMSIMRATAVLEHVLATKRTLPDIP